MDILRLRRWPDASNRLSKRVGMQVSWFGRCVDIGSIRDDFPQANSISSSPTLLRLGSRLSVLRHSPNEVPNLKEIYWFR